jgi:hypothetical protein
MAAELILDLLDDLRESLWSAYCVAHDADDFDRLCDGVLTGWAREAFKVETPDLRSRFWIKVHYIQKWRKKLALNFR